MPIPDKPYTRREAYLNAAATGDSSGIPETPYTREEMYLDAIARGGGGGGGGGSSTLSGLTDVDISNPTDGQTLVYNATSGKWENGAGGGGGGSLPDYNAGDTGKVLTVVSQPSGRMQTLFPEQTIQVDGEPGVVSNADLSLFVAGAQISCVVDGDTYTSTVNIFENTVSAEFPVCTLYEFEDESTGDMALLFWPDHDDTFIVSASVEAMETSATWQTPSGITPSGITFVDLQDSYGSVTDVSTSAAQAWAIKDNSLLVIRTEGNHYYPYRVVNSYRYSDNDPVGHLYSFLAGGAVPDSGGQYATGCFIDLFLEDATQTAYWVAAKNWAGRSTG